MGWSSGTTVIYETWNVVREFIPEEKRAGVLAKVIDVFEDADWDNVDEISEDWPESKEAILIKHPDFFDDDE